MPTASISVISSNTAPKKPRPRRKPSPPAPCPAATCAAQKGTKSSVLPPEWKSSDDVGARQQLTLEIVGDLFRHGAVGPAWKAAVHIALVDRRRTRARAEGRVIHRRHDDDSARDIVRVERTSEFVKRQRALIFVSVIAARQECRRSLAVRMTQTGIITEPQAESSRL